MRLVKVVESVQSDENMQVRSKFFGVGQILERGSVISVHKATQKKNIRNLLIGGLWN